MKHLTFSPAALADLDAIWDYTADRWNIEQADNNIDSIAGACRDLCSRRKIGRVVELRAGYLKYGIGSHVIFYREQEDRLEVIRILHGRMDIDRHL